MQTVLAIVVFVVLLMLIMFLPAWEQNVHFSTLQPERATSISIVRGL